MDNKTKQQFSPRLVKALAQINEILEQENIAGVVVLAIPGFVQSGIKVDPSWSCCRIEGGKYKINARLWEDFGGDAGAMKQRMTDTMDMLNALTMTGARAILPLGDIARTVNKAADDSNPATNN